MGGGVPPAPLDAPPDPWLPAVPGLPPIDALDPPRPAPPLPPALLPPVLGMVTVAPPLPWLPPLPPVPARPPCSLGWPPALPPCGFCAVPSVPPPPCSPPPPPPPFALLTSTGVLAQAQSRAPPKNATGTSDGNRAPAGPGIRFEVKMCWPQRLNPKAFADGSGPASIPRSFTFAFTGPFNRAYFAGFTKRRVKRSLSPILAYFSRSSSPPAKLGGKFQTPLG